MAFLDLRVPHGRLEALLQDAPEPTARAIVCHPHPLHGGTLHNHVTHRLSKALVQGNVSALRFNFRGVGRSTGTFDDGKGEVDDAEWALDFVSRQDPKLPLWTSGFSFGARVALALAARDPRVRRVLAVGLPVGHFDMAFLARVTQPVALVHGEEDEFASPEEVQRAADLLPGQHRLFVVAKCDHLATGKLAEVEATLGDAVQWLRAAGSGHPRGTGVFLE